MRRGHLLQVLHVGGISFGSQFLHDHVPRYFLFLFLDVFVRSDLLQSLPQYGIRVVDLALVVQHLVPLRLDIGQLQGFTAD